MVADKGPYGVSEPEENPVLASTVRDRTSFVDTVSPMRQHLTSPPHVRFVLALKSAVI